MGMLFVGREQLSKEQFCQRFGLDLKKIMKHPSFEVAKHRKVIDRANGNIVKAGKGMGMRSHFMATDPRTSLKVEVRYAQSHIPKQVGNVLQDVFEPRYVQFMGMKKAFQNDPELALYFAVHPTNSESPLRDPKNTTKPKITYIDTKKRAEEKNATIDALTEALEHAKNLDESKLVILAKGLGIKGVSTKEIEDIRADVREFAYKFPKIYNEKALSQITYYEGRILHLVDLQIIKLSSIGSIRRWSWASGERSGETIVDIQNSTVDAKTALKNHIFNDINNYMYLLNNITDTETARQKAERVLSEKEEVNTEVVLDAPVIGDALPEHLKNVGSTLVEELPEIPRSYQEAVEILTKKNGKRPSPTDASKFWKEHKGE